MRFQIVLSEILSTRMEVDRVSSIVVRYIVLRFSRRVFNTHSQQRTGKNFWLRSQGMNSHSQQGGSKNFQPRRYLSNKEDWDSTTASESILRILGIKICLTINGLSSGALAQKSDTPVSL